jgi:hypothetical protein
VSGERHHGLAAHRIADDREAADPAAPLDGVRGELDLDGGEQTTVKVVATALPSTALDRASGRIGTS